jgi:hypothetical protein
VEAARPANLAGDRLHLVAKTVQLTERGRTRRRPAVAGLWRGKQRPTVWKLQIECWDGLSKVDKVKTTAKRRPKSDADVLDRATKNLARALKHDMIKKNGRVDYDKLRREGYSERLLEKLQRA